MAAARIASRSTVALSFRRGQCWRVVRWPLLCPFPRSTQPMRASGSPAMARCARRARGEAIARAAETPHILLNAPLTGQRLGYPDLSGLDLLELFAFVHPARFAVPTVPGMCRALGIAVPEGEIATVEALGAIAEALLARLGDQDWPEREGAWTSNATLAPARLGLGGADRRAAGAAGARPSGCCSRGCQQWDEGAERPRRAPFRFGEDDAIARLAELTGAGAEPREGQKAMAAAVAGIFAPRRAAGEPNMLLAEAGTGIGKTLAYLAPASLWAERAGGAVWVSTFTKALQRQLDAEGARLIADAGRARAADRGPQGARELSVPAQSRGCAAGRVFGAGGDTGATGRALGGLFEGRRHGRRRPAGLAAEPVPPGGRDRADRPARRVRLCRLPALPPLLHRARRAGGARGGRGHRQPCPGDGQRRARPRRASRRRGSCSTRAIICSTPPIRPSRSRWAGPEAIELRRWIVGPEVEGARAAAGACRRG